MLSTGMLQYTCTQVAKPTCNHKKVWYDSTHDLSEVLAKTPGFLCEDRMRR